MGNSFGCSATGERLVSAARDGDFQEAQALLECNPRLAKYSTFGVRNSPLHFSAMQGHTEIVTLLLECGVEVNTRNYCGQTALMQACRYGHWEVAQTLLLYKANVTRADYLNGRTALHFAARNGHARCIRLVVADYVPSVPYLWNTLQVDKPEDTPTMKNYMDRTALSRLVNKPADGGICALHMAALNGHTECVQLLLDLMANVSAITVQDGTTIDMIGTGAGSTPLHYAACGGSIPCCQALISRGALRNVANCNGWTPLQVARLWRRHWLEPLLAPDSQLPIPSFPPSRYLALPLMSIMRIARDCGWRDTDHAPGGTDPCAVCLERKCTVAAEGCGHELCTRCALYLSTTMNVSSTVTNPPGSVPCPLCRRGIVAFDRLPTTISYKEMAKANMTLALCTTCTAEVCEPTVMGSLLSKVDFRGCRVSPLSSSSARITCPSFSALNLSLNCSTTQSVGDSPDYESPEQYVSARTSTRTESTEWTAAGDGDSTIEETLSSSGLVTATHLPSAAAVVHIAPSGQDEPTKHSKQFACCRVRTKCGFPKVFYWRHYGGVNMTTAQPY
ncbi:E3 ubiquitin-protein ligase XBAT32/33 [Marchantia polymorpha subsp. ruderalis]|uniref:RING-type E3 ubiquitin transferase n=2 Tax=Marchantia polymorpha TaxID=3197 RepID=A0AAF6BUX5_MARPO|nr:hypothetical protein MARPO_0046s0020 [Marchantia polymorpha]BBN15809.1 hypothetical protein Mp_7g01040 [Marchantia polymorpha subsp. ruderalis]|eukprot:PTQ39197.1 hypothetical protein MARPO_0046s0020 [Marchantia polymorpha]